MFPSPPSSQATRNRGSHSSCSGWDKYVPRNTARDFLGQLWAVDLFITLCLSSSSFCFVSCCSNLVHLPVQPSGGAEQPAETCTDPIEQPAAMGQAQHGFGLVPASTRWAADEEEGSRRRKHPWQRWHLGRQLSWGSARSCFLSPPRGK